MKKALTWLAVTFGIVVVLLASLLIFLRYFFPSDLVRAELERVLSRTLQGTVRIESLIVDPFSGLETRHVEVVRQNHPLLRLETMTLRYRLRDLLRNKLVVHEIALTNADVSVDLLDFAPADRGAQPAPSPPPAPPSTAPIPAVPVSLDLEKLTIRHSNVRLAVTRDLFVAVSNMDLTAAARVDASNAALSGSLAIEQVDLRSGEKTLQVPLALDFSVLADLANQDLTLESLTMEIAPAVRLALSGRMKGFLSAKSIEIRLQQGSVNLGPLLAKANAFLPPQVAALKVLGVVRPEAALKGELRGSTFSGHLSALVQAQNVEVVSPAVGGTLRPSDLTIEVSDILIRGNQPTSGSGQVTVRSQGADAQGYSVTDLDAVLTGHYAETGTISGTMRMHGTATTPPTQAGGSLTLPVEAEVVAQGNAQTLELTLDHAAVKVGSLLDLAAKGTARQHPAKAKRLLLSLSARIEPHVDSLASHLLARLPKGRLPDVSIRTAGGKDLILADLQATVNQAFQPEEVELSSTVHLEGIAAEWSRVRTAARLDQLTVAVQAGYQATSGLVQAKVAGDLALSNLSQGGTLHIRRTTLSLGSKVGGRVDQAKGLINLIAQDALTVRVQGLRYETANLRASFDGLTVTATTKEDLSKGDYRVEQLKVTEESLGVSTVTASFNQATQRFSFDLAIPSLNIGKALERMSGPAVETVRQVKPRGRVSLRLTSSGRLPKTTPIDPLNLPLAMTCQVTLKDVEGAFGDQAIFGSNGTLDLSVNPQAGPLLRLATDLRAKAIQLPAGLPINRATDVYATIQLTGMDGNELTVKEMRAGAKGLRVATEGTVTGLKGLWTDRGKGLGKQLERLFAQLRTTVAVDLSAFPDLLDQFGLKGSGGVELILSVLKQDQGPIDLRLQVDPQHVTVTRGNLRVVNMDGSLLLHKRLRWNGRASTQEGLGAFNPSEMLSELRAYPESGTVLTVKELALPQITVTDLATTVQFDREKLKIQNLSLQVLGGGVGGTLVLTTGQPFGITALLEAAQLDVTRLLDHQKPGASLNQGAGTVYGVLKLAAFFEEEAGALDLGRSELTLHLTRIGKDALDRVLLFLDPEGSNPPIVKARSHVKLANPSEVKIDLARGMLGVDIRFSEGLLSSFKMDRIPVARLYNLKTVTQKIPQWDLVAKAMRMIGTEEYGVDPDGGLVVQ